MIVATVEIDPQTEVPPAQRSARAAARGPAGATSPASVGAASQGPAGDASQGAAGATSPASARATSPASEIDALLAGVRRLTQLADSASDPQAIFGALVAELLRELPSVQEVQVHELSSAQDTVTIHLYGGESCLSYLRPQSERPAGVAWVAGTGQSVLAAGARELHASVPRLAAAGRVGSALLLPLSVHGEVEAVVILVQRAVESFAERAAQHAATLVDQGATALALLRARAEAGTDPVTGCMNHRAMRRRLSEEIDRATRTAGKLACMLIDLDNFKLVNDRHGHAAGDALLREVAQALMGEFRAFDRVARYGGDEFVVILAGADLQSAAVAAERARERMLGLSSFEIAPGVSGSIGVAQWRAGMSTDTLLDACDAALLRGKREGKGRVTRAA
jgi:diguanylate cyclase (GGDEF)-like protein